MVETRIEVGTICVIERRIGWAPLSAPAQHRWEKPIAKLTAKRAYFDDRDWFALDDPTREVKPKYLDYRTFVVELRPATDKRSTP